jgi:hypothetical protein
MNFSTTFSFKVYGEVLETLTNYGLYLKPNGIYKTKKIIADNYLYPLYYIRECEIYVVSTSVYSLIHYKKTFIKDPKFQTTFGFRPTFLTPDIEIKRARTLERITTKQITDSFEIAKLGSKIIQDYITEIEDMYKGYTHVLLMGGKDSQNLLLANRKADWIAVTGEPNCDDNEYFLTANQVKLKSYLRISNQTDNSLLSKEIISMDCMYDVAHFRYCKDLERIISQSDNKVVLWMGTAGDGIFSKSHCHLYKNWNDFWNLHIGPAMGVLHQGYKNLFDIPVLSPYQCPKMLDELFYKYDPYYVHKNKDIRPLMGEILYGRKVEYPSRNLTPDPWKRSRFISLKVYTHQIKNENIKYSDPYPLKNTFYRWCEKIRFMINRYSVKKRSFVSKLLVPIRIQLSKIIPSFKIRRYEIDEIK